MNKQCKVRSCVQRVFRWAGQNLILSVIIVVGIIAIWPNHIPRPQVTRNFQTKGRMNHVVSETAMMDSVESGGRAAFSRVGKMMIPPVFADDFAPEAEERKIVRNASLQIEVSDTESARKEVEAKIAKLKGHVTNLRSREARAGVLSYNITIRIPADNLSKAMDDLISMGVKKSESINEQDITAQYMDTENRLKNLEVRRDRLRELMDRKTDNLSDVLQIDRELSNVQQQIENFERTLRRHDANVLFSTITLSLQPEPQIGDFHTPEWTVQKSWKHSVNDLIASLKTIFDGALRLLVFAPIWFPILLFLWSIQRFVRRRTCCSIKLKK